MRISLTPGQAVSIHGWMRARQTLTWGDVLSLPGLTFQGLLSYNLAEQDLYVLQPDLQAWVRAGKATLADCPKMRPWDAHPICDFKADLADLVGMHWPHELLARMGVDYDELLGLGLTAETMTSEPLRLHPDDVVLAGLPTRPRRAHRRQHALQHVRHGEAGHPRLPALGRGRASPLHILHG